MLKRISILVMKLACICCSIFSYKSEKRDEAGARWLTLEPAQLLAYGRIKGLNEYAPVSQCQRRHCAEYRSCRGTHCRRIWALTRPQVKSCQGVPRLSKLPGTFWIAIERTWAHPWRLWQGQGEWGRKRQDANSLFGSLTSPQLNSHVSPPVVTQVPAMASSQEELCVSCGQMKPFDSTSIGLPENFRLTDYTKLKG